MASGFRINIDSRRSVMRIDGDITHKAGTHKFPNEILGCWKYGVDTRSCRQEIAVELRHSKLDDVLRTVKKCAAGCAIGAIIVSLATGAGAAATWTGFK